MHDSVLSTVPENRVRYWKNHLHTNLDIDAKAAVNLKNVVFSCLHVASRCIRGSCYWLSRDIPLGNMSLSGAYTCLPGLVFQLAFSTCSFLARSTLQSAGKRFASILPSGAAPDSSFTSELITKLFPYAPVRVINCQAHGAMWEGERTTQYTQPRRWPLRRPHSLPPLYHIFIPNQPVQLSVYSIQHASVTTTCFFLYRHLRYPRPHRFADCNLISSSNYFYGTCGYQ